MSIDREALEREALLGCSAALYYDLADCIDSLSNEDLYNIIDADGDEEKELYYGEQ